MTRNPLKASKGTHQTRYQRPASASRPTTAARLDQNPIDFVPSPDEVARKAYFTYVNEGSRPGHDVQHWLQAEEQLLTERNITRIHGFHNRT
jgi:hypothetical protein